MSHMDPKTAHELVVNLTKQAFFGRLRQYGVEPQTEKEAAALFDLGLDLHFNTPEDSHEKTAGQAVNYGDGPFACAKYAYDMISSQQEIAPGFPAKQASAAIDSGPTQLPPALIEGAYNVAIELAQNPQIYAAALTKRAANEAAWAHAHGGT